MPRQKSLLSQISAAEEKLKEQINKLSDVEVKTKVVKKTSMNSNKKSASLIDLGNLLEGGDSN